MMSWIEEMVNYVFPPVDEPQLSDTAPLAAETEPSEPADSGVMNISMFEPRRIEDADTIIHCINEETNAAFVNFSRMSHGDALRVFDRISGAVCALSGHALMVNDHVLYCARRPLVKG